MKWAFLCSRVQRMVVLLGAVFIGECQTSLAALSADYRADQIIIQPKANVSPAALAHFHTLRQSQVAKTFAKTRLQVLRVPQNETVASLIAKYQASGLVEFAEPDYLVHAAAAEPKDPKFADGTQWEFNNTGQNGGTPDADIDGPEAWEVLNSASNVVVAVLDTGIRYTHEDLAANMWVNTNDGGHGFNAFTGTNDVADDNGHGTFVAGLLGAVGDNGKGIAGTVWSVQLMACKCLNSSGAGSDSTVIACIDYARTNGAQIINASLESYGASLAVSNAIVAARDAGIIVVASAGNGNPRVNVDVTPTYPACYDIDNIVSVACTTRTDGLGIISNYGATNVDLAAPGDDIFSTYNTSDTAYYPQSSFIHPASTSYAAPQVSGTMALLITKYPGENYRQIINRVLAAVDPLPSLAGKCVTGGRLNLWKALSPPIHLASVPVANGGPFHLQLSTGANRTCVIESSLDLINWSPLFTNITSSNGIFDFVNESSTNAPQQFYRATSAP